MGSNTGPRGSKKNGVPENVSDYIEIIREVIYFWSREKIDFGKNLVSEANK